jgi:hypothetical protein
MRACSGEAKASRPDGAKVFKSELARSTTIRRHSKSRHGLLGISTFCSWKSNIDLELYMLLLLQTGNFRFLRKQMPLHPNTQPWVSVLRKRAEPGPCPDRVLICQFLSPGMLLCMRCTRYTYVTHALYSSRGARHTLHTSHMMNTCWGAADPRNHRRRSVPGYRCFPRGSRPAAGRTRIRVVMGRVFNTPC